MALVTKADSVERLLVNATRSDMSPTDLPVMRMQADLVWTTCLSLVYASTLCRTMGWTSSTTQKGCIYQDVGGGCYI